MRAFLALLLAALAAPAAALEICDELWFTRNLIYDRAGYCFSSPLGRAVFDNSDCTGSALKIAEIFQKGGLPDGLFTVLVIDHDTSDEIIAYDKVRGVTLTGSDDAG